MTFKLLKVKRYPIQTIKLKQKDSVDPTGEVGGDIDLSLISSCYDKADIVKYAKNALQYLKPDA